MTETSKAWVWSQYRGVAGETAEATPLPLFRNSNAETGSDSSKRIKWGASVGVAMLVGLLFPKIAFLLLIFSGLLVLWGLEPKRFEDFLNGFPGGSIVLKILAIADAALR
jgi:hypothetical protein